VKYAFIKDHRTVFRVRSMCRVLHVHHSGFYAWLRRPESRRTQQDKELLTTIRFSYEDSGKVYGSRRVHRDLRDWGSRCGEKRVARIMRENGIVAQRGYKKHRYQAGKPATTAPNLLQQNFDVATPNLVWVTDITYIRTYEGWLYLAAVMDLFSRKIVGWAMGPNLKAELVLDALIMAVWRRKPEKGLIIHSDQGSQFGSYDWTSFLKDHGIEASMSRRGNCYDNAAKESFFASLKMERVRGKVYPSRRIAKADVFEYMEMFYNPKRRHSYLDYVSPADYENAYYEENKCLQNRV